MDFSSLVDTLLDDTLRSIDLFVPELILCVTMVLMLLAKLPNITARINPFWLAMLGAIAALVMSLPVTETAEAAATQPVEMFTGMLVFDSMSLYVRVLLLSFAVLFLLLSALTGLADRTDGQDFYTLVLGATLGMCIMASANNLMTVFLGIEMASVPSYVLAGTAKARRSGGEAALKYAIYGAGAAGVMLYGISLLAGVTGTTHIPSIAVALSDLDFNSAEAGQPAMVLALSGLMIAAGLAFKLSAVPFHFWCPDVFEGASAEVDAFLSVASKAAALALLIRVAVGLTSPGDATVDPSVDPIAAASAATTAPVSFVASNSPSPARLVADEADQGEIVTSMDSVRHFISLLILVLSAVTCTFGNLAAYGQTNVKRLLAYSTIAHAGYMMMPVAAAVHLTGTNPELSQDAISAVLFYAGVYFFMNLGAFAIVAFLRNSMGSEEIADYAGLIRSVPLVTICMTGILFSLVGLPPLGGFWAKVGAFMALVHAGGPWFIGLLVVGGINTVISLVYYLRLAKTMCMDPEPETRGQFDFPIIPAVYVAVVSLPVFVLGLLPDPLARLAELAGLNLYL